MKKLIVSILLLVIFGCSEQREVQLPHTSFNEITEVADVSPVYMFYDEINDTVIFNRKNLISTTNWLVNIDKRLTLQQILPHLQYLQNKRQKAGMHKNEAARNYFTCFNPKTKGLSFIDFTDVAFIEQNRLNDSSSDSIFIELKGATTFQEYITLKSELALNKNDSLFVSPREFIHN